MPLSAYIIASVALILKPGPDLMFIIAASIASGALCGFAVAAGTIVGVFCWIALLAAGFVPFFLAHPLVMAVIRGIGEIYILYLAFSTLREAHREWENPVPKNVPDAESVRQPFVRLFLRGLAMAASNPLTIMFFLAFLPQFLDNSETAASPRVQVLYLGLVFVALIPIVEAPIIFAAGALRRIFDKRPRVQSVLKGISGVILLAVAALLACL